MVRECGHEGRWVVVLSNRMPSRRRRSLRPLGLLLALVAASVAASAFVGTARADDPAPASGGAATNPPAASPDPTPSTDPPAAPTEPPSVSAGAQSAATNPPPDPPAAPTDPPAAPADPPAAPTDPPAGATDPPAAPVDPPAASTGPPAVSTDPPAAESKASDIAPPPSATTDPPAASTDPPASTPPNADVNTGLGSPQVTDPERVTIVPFPITAAKMRAVVRNSWLDDCRFSVLCGGALLARSPFESAQALFNSWPLREASSTQRGSRSGGDRDRTVGAQPPRVPIPPPAPNHQPDGPTAPGAFFGFGSSGGFHNGGLLALMAVLLGFTFLQSTRRVTPPEQRVHGPLLVLSLERPG